jgi:hypothetical protein
MKTGLQLVGLRCIDVIDFEFGSDNRSWRTAADTIDKVGAESLVALVRRHRSQAPALLGALLR